MSYEVVGACLAENLQLLQGAFGVVPPENRSLWNLSNALLNFSMAVEGDLNQIQTQLRTIRQELDDLSRRR